MLKFLIIMALILYLVFRVGGFFMRTLFGSTTMNRQGEFRNRGQQKVRPKDGNVDIDYVPEDRDKKDGYEGGDYIDYEEVK